MNIKCYAYSLSDEPFLAFTAKTPEEMIDRLSDDVSWRDHVNDIWVKIGPDSLLYNPMLHIFRDWDGQRFVQIDNKRLRYFF